MPDKEKSEKSIPKAPADKPVKMPIVKLDPKAVDDRPKDWYDGSKERKKW